MPKELKDYLHLLLGCECEVDFARYISSKAIGKFEPKERVRCVFDSINKNKDIDQCWGVTVINDNGFKYYDVFDRLVGFYTDFVHSTSIKPILRHLSDMTDEECDEYNKIAETMFSINKVVDQMRTQAAIIVYLLSKRLDPFGLIEVGLAIDAKTLTKAA